MVSFATRNLFPQTKAGPRYQIHFPLLEIELFCTLSDTRNCYRLTYYDIMMNLETYDDMVECDMCGDWYHLKCVSL